MRCAHKEVFLFIFIFYFYFFNDVMCMYVCHYLHTGLFGMLFRCNHCFQLLGVDLILDKFLNASIMEVGIHRMVVDVSDLLYC